MGTLSPLAFVWPSVPALPWSLISLSQVGGLPPLLGGNFITFVLTGLISRNQEADGQARSLGPSSLAVVSDMHRMVCPSGVAGEGRGGRGYGISHGTYTF